MKSMFIGVISHKDFKMDPREGYFPVFVGENALNLKKSYASVAYSDCDGKNIHSLNPYYSELTAQYWISKNITDVDYKGLVHYRRFLTDNKGMYLEKNKILETIETHPIILSEKVYSKTTVYETYSRFHNIEDLNMVRAVINEIFPEYINAFDHLMQQHSYHSLNILIAKSELFDCYTDWLFNILFEVQKRITIIDDTYQRRVFGFLSERLLDVWITTQNISYKEFPVSMVGQNQSSRIVKSIKQHIYSRVFRSE